MHRRFRIQTSWGLAAALVLSLLGSNPVGAAELQAPPDGVVKDAPAEPPAEGEQPDKAKAQKHLTMEEIVVTDDRLDEASNTAVTSRRIEQGKNISIPDVLRNEPDIDIKRQTLIGDSADNVSIRGFSSNRVMLNINGRSVNGAGVVGGNYIDWSTVPLDNIEKIEIIKGGSSAKYGNNALGGVINVVTKRPSDKPTLNFFSNYGFSKDIDSIQNYRLSHSYKVGPVGYAISGSYQKSAPYLWNNDFEAHNMAANFYIDMPLGGELSLGYQYANAEKGLIRNNRLSSDPLNPGYYVKILDDYPLASGATFAGPSPGKASTTGPDGHWDKIKTYLDLGYAQPIGEALVEFKAYRNNEDRYEKNYSTALVNTSYPEGQMVLKRKVEADRSAGGNLEVKAPLGDHELLLGAEHKLLAYGDIITDYVDVVYDKKAKNPCEIWKPTSESLLWGYYVQDNWRLGERWQLMPGLRYDTYRDRNKNGGTGRQLKTDAFSPKLTVTYAVSEHDTVTASLYRALRTPTMPESGWWSGGGADHGVPALKSEMNDAAELLYMHRFAGADFVRVSGYYYKVNDYIERRNLTGWRTAYNIDEVKQAGVSLDGRVELLDWASANGSVTYQHSTVRGDMFDPGRLTKGLSSLPEWKSSLGAEFELPRKAVFNVNLRHVGLRVMTKYDSANNPYRYRMDPYMTTDVSLNLPLGKHLQFGCYAENLFSEEYEEREGYPMPGVVVGATLKMSL